MEQTGYTRYSINHLIKNKIMLNKKEEEVKKLEAEAKAKAEAKATAKAEAKPEVVDAKKDIHGWEHQASVAAPAIANNPFPAENPNVPASMLTVEGDKKSDEVLLALTKKIQSKEEFRVKFSIGDSGAYQYYGCVIALRNGQTPLIKSNEILIDAFREIATEAQLHTLAGLDEKLNAEYFAYIVALRGAK